MCQTVRITAASRLHFGLLSVGENVMPPSGGVGVMVRRPSLQLLLRRGESRHVTGPHAHRVSEFIRIYRRRTGVDARVSCEVQAAPPAHVGLGLGTQLGMSVAAGLDTMYGRNPVSIEQRARSVRRGLRSAIGCHGFHQGGLIVDAGKTRGADLGTLQARIALPPNWRILLVWPANRQGLAGDAERRAFETLPVADSLSRKMAAELRERLAPAAKQGDFHVFSESVHRYGVLAGECFAPCQGGPFASAEVALIVRWLRDAGVSGVGQSSWGPTVFGWFPDEASAQRMATKFRNRFSDLPVSVLVTQVADRGACIQTDGNT